MFVGVHGGDGEADDGVGEKDDGEGSGYAVRVFGFLERKNGGSKKWV